MIKSQGITVLLLFILLILSCSPAKQNNTIPLKGKWSFQADPQDVGITNHWYRSRLADTVTLPGSMRENNKGDELTLETKWTGSIYDSSWYFRTDLAKYRQKDHLKFPFWLTPNKHYVGAAWFQREVVIPAQWEDRHIELFLERPHWETTVWVDSLQAGTQNSLSTPHRYDLSDLLKPGRHLISIRVDNRIKDINVGPDSHSITDHTQGNWNGITGDICLKSTAPVFMDGIQLFTDVEDKSVKAVIQLDNRTGKDGTSRIVLDARSFNSAKTHVVPQSVREIAVPKGKSSIEILYSMGEAVQLWDEFDPALYQMTVVLSDETGNRDTKKSQFGMRSFVINGTRFEINRRPVFLRGTVECCVFPATGYPPVDVTSWERVFLICRDHGLNHMRFHSWCPPEAAFEAADKLGFYLQVEGPSWANHGVRLGDGLPIDRYIYDETNRIADAYGNHPSFCMMAYGNEPAGRNQAGYLGEFVNYWKAKDNRRVYTSASIGKNWPLVPESEFIVRSEPRGLPWKERPQSMFDYAERIEKYAVPYVVHEMGQYCVFPNFREIKKYTGVYKARNFELFQETLVKNHMGDQAGDFLTASGKLQALCYKSEIEAALRTRGLAGIQLLGLNDFPGQGTALVGVLDAFWDEKEYFTAQQFNRFFGETVPLARMPKFVFLNSETLHAEFEVAHFGRYPLNSIAARWKVTDPDGTVLAQGLLKERDIPIDNCIPLGEIEWSLAGISTAQKLKLELFVDNHVNHWNFWVYPDVIPPQHSDDIYVCNQPDERAEFILENGGNVFIHAAGHVENGKDVVQYFRPVFWNTSWFKMRPPHTTGILCDPEHPAFAYFPTDFHSDLQWWEILDRQQVMNIERFPPEFRPIVQPIDTWFLNRRLALLFEAQVGKGKIMVCSADLQSDPDDRPAARQLLYSLTQYMLSDRFNPKTRIEYAVIEELFEKKERAGIAFHTKQSTEDLKPK
ncbi:beta-glucuronidase [bacterium]|nr:beta-glucuronidase [bacterium]